MLLPDVTLQPVCGFLTGLHHSFDRAAQSRQPSHPMAGASGESGRCPQLSSVSCLCRPQEPVVFFVRFTRTLVPPFQLLLFLLILDSSFQELFQVTFFSQCKPFPNFIAGAANSFPSLFATRCHSKKQVMGDEGYLAPQPLDWSCCVGFRCLHLAIQGLKSNRRVSAIQ